MIIMRIARGCHLTYTVREGKHNVITQHCSLYYLFFIIYLFSDCNIRQKIEYNGKMTQYKAITGYRQAIVSTYV